jgi:hypothetical protein
MRIRYCSGTEVVRCASDEGHGNGVRVRSVLTKTVHGHPFELVRVFVHGVAA